LAGEKFPAGTFQGAQLGRGRRNDREGGSAGEVDAQCFADKFGAAAVLGFADALDLKRHRARHRDGHERRVAGIDGHRVVILLQTEAYHGWLAGVKWTV